MHGYKQQLPPRLARLHSLKKQQQLDEDWQKRDHDGVLIELILLFQDLSAYTLHSCLAGYAFDTHALMSH